MKSCWLIFIAFLVARTKCECPAPFVQLETGCYFFSLDARNWWDAADTCRQHDSVLAEVETAEEDAVLIQQVTTIDRPFWFGGSDRLRDDRWVWESTGEQLLYTGWEVGQPKNLKTHNCLVYWKHPTYKWHDGECSVMLSYICEKGKTQSLHRKCPDKCFRPSCSHLSSDTCSGTGKIPTQRYSCDYSERDKCEPPFIQLDTGCYFFSDQVELNWWEAVETCRDYNSVLATVDSFEESEAIKAQAIKKAPGKSFWLGGFDLGHEGRWLWESTLKPLLYTNWDTHQPDNNKGGNEHCLQLIKDARLWNDAPCDNKYGFICKQVVISKPACRVEYVHAAASAADSERNYCNCLAEKNVNFMTLH